MRHFWLKAGAAAVGLAAVAGIGAIPFMDFVPRVVPGAPAQGEEDWQGRVHATDADGGAWAWRAKLDHPGGARMTPVPLLARETVRKPRQDRNRPHRAVWPV